jgi:DNA polymerase I-like protein with 3'-5' exonuclease and polymerase domains
MSTAAKLLAVAHVRGIQTTAEGESLRVRGPKSALTPKMKRLLTKYKPDILAILSEDYRLDTKPGLSRVFSRGVDTKPQKTSGNNEVSYPRTPKSRLLEAFGADEKPPVLAVPFGDEELPFGIWDGQQLNGRLIGIDTETTPIEPNTVPRLILASVSDGEQHYVLPRDRIVPFLRLHDDRVYAAHNATFDHWVLVSWLGEDAELWWQIVDPGRLRCMDLMEQLILLAKFDNHPRPHSLDKLAQHYLDVELFGKDDPRRTQFSLIENIPLDQVAPWFLQYAAQDAIAVVKIYRQQRVRARHLQPDPADLLPDAKRKYGLLSEIIQVKGAIVLDRISRAGMHLDTERLEPTRAELREKVFGLVEELESAAPVPVVKRYKQARFITDTNRGYKLNSSGTPQIDEKAIRELFQQVADQHGLKPPQSNTGQLSLTKHCWSDHRELSPIVDAFLELKAQSKLYGFFIGLDGRRIHPEYVPFVRSGRVSCRNPNIQQLPRSGGVREVFVPSPGHVLFIIDFSALELRTLAAVCLKRYGKSRLAEVFQQGIDAHTYAYCEIHGVTLEEFSAWKKKDPAAAKAARNKIKPISFGVPGSMQAAGLAQYAKRSYGQELSVEEAGQLRDHLIRDVFPEWQEFLSQTGNRVYTLTGRVRGRIQRAGQLFNTQFQGLANDGAKLCMYALLRAGYRLTAFVHDEFHVELPIGCNYTAEAERINEICCRTMEELTLGVPIECEYALANHWSKAVTELRDEHGHLLVWSAPAVKQEKDSGDMETSAQGPVR